MSHDDHHGHHDHQMSSPIVESVAESVGEFIDHTSHNMMMSMTFHFGVEETILFEFWKINSLFGMSHIVLLFQSFIGLLISCGIIFLLCLLYEGVKAARRFIYEHRHNRARCCNNDTTIASTTAASVNAGGVATDANGSSNSPLLIRFTRGFVILFLLLFTHLSTADDTLFFQFGTIYEQRSIR